MPALPRPIPLQAPDGFEEAFHFIAKKAAALPFGTITLVIHDGKPTQMEVTEKRRFGP